MASGAFAVSAAAFSRSTNLAALRASGVQYDLRRNDPYCIYDKFDFEIPVRHNGDCFDRYLLRLDEIKQSIRIINQALDGLPEGEIKHKKARLTYKAPAGENFTDVINYIACVSQRRQYTVQFCLA